MNVSDKLKSFEAAAMEEALLKQDDMKKEMDDRYKEVTIAAEREGAKAKEDKLKRESQKAIQEKNRLLQSAQSEGRQKLTALKMRLTDQLFSDAEKGVLDFVNTPAYADYLCDKINEGKNKYGQITAVLMERDEALVRVITDRTGVQVSLTKEDFLGGLKIIIEGKNAMEDYTLRTRLDEERLNFTKLNTGGLQ